MSAGPGICPWPLLGVGAAHLGPSWRGGNVQQPCMFLEALTPRIMAQSQKNQVRSQLCSPCHMASSSPKPLWAPIFSPVGGGTCLLPEDGRRK